jgi:hypothetical protein
MDEVKKTVIPNVNFIKLIFYNNFINNNSFGGRYSDWVKGWKTEEKGLASRPGQEIFLISIMSTKVLGLTKLPVQRLPGPFSPEGG